MSNRVRVYTWEFPVRLTHWVNVLCILALSATGIYIGSPYMHATSANQYVMGWMRFVHFVAAYAFLMSFVIRLYWSFVGNKYSSWRVWIPLTQRQRKDLVDAAKFYSFISRKPPYAVGHTALAGFTYLFVFLMFAFEIISGFALYGQAHHGAIWGLMGGWLLGIMHVQTVRLFHHVVMYLIMAFVLVHVYIAWYLDVVEKNGVMGSIFGGYKFVTGKEWE